MTKLINQHLPETPDINPEKSPLGETNQLKKVMVYIPAFNEEESIGEIIDNIFQLYPLKKTQEKGYKLDVLVVDDGSTDRTREIALAKRVTVESHTKNLGLGASARTGMQMAYDLGADVAVKLDADFQHLPCDIEKVVIPLLEDKADVCWGSRFKGEIHYRMPFVRFVGNKFFTFLVNTLTDYKVSDAQTGLKAFNRKYLSVFEIFGNFNESQQTIIDASHKHMRYTEVPVDFHLRKTGKSFINFKYPFYVGVNIFRMLTFAHPLKVFATIGLTLIFFSMTYFALAVFSYQYHWDTKLFHIDKFVQVTLITGIQSCFFGILADLIIRRK